MTEGSMTEEDGKPHPLMTLKDYADEIDNLRAQLAEANTFQREDALRIIDRQKAQLEEAKRPECCGKLMVWTCKNCDPMKAEDDAANEIADLRAQLERMKCGHLKAELELRGEIDEDGPVSEGCFDTSKFKLVRVCRTCEELATARREEREACAKEAESFLRGNLRHATEPLATISDTGEWWIKTIAAAIRALEDGE